MDSQGVRGLGGAVNFFAPIGVKLRAIFLINLIFCANVEKKSQEICLFTLIGSLSFTPQQYRLWGACPLLQS